jgi:hypothetical protein
MRAQHAQELRETQEQCKADLRRAHEGQLVIERQLDDSRCDIEKVCVALGKERKLTAPLQEQLAEAVQLLDKSKALELALEVWYDLCT